MSHFTVAVFTDGNKSVEELLAPYQENNMGDCPEEYMEFNDVTDEYMKEYENDGNEMVKTPEGELLYKWDDRFRKPNTIGTGSDTHKVPENQGYEIVYVKHNEKYKNFDDFVQDYGGYKKNEKTGKYGYWENPNAKWDWYQEGGRWSGLLKLKFTLYLASNNTFNTLGFNHNEFLNFVNWYKTYKEKFDLIIKKYKGVEQKIIDEVKKYIGMMDGDAKRVNSAKVKDIDFSLDIDEYNKAIRFWELIVDGDTPKNDKEIDEIKWCFYKSEYYSNRYKNKEQYAQLTTEFGTYAVITPDGKWHSKGDMGWFGFSSESFEEANSWSVSFKEKFIDNADPEWTLTVVDCHI